MSAPAAAAATTADNDAADAAADAAADEKNDSCCDRCVSRAVWLITTVLSGAEALYDRLVWQNKAVLLVWWVLASVYYFVTAVMANNDLPRPRDYLSSVNFESFNTSGQMLDGCCYTARTATLRPLTWCSSDNFLPEFYSVRQLLTVFDSAFPWVALGVFLYHISGLLYINRDVLRTDTAARNKLKDVLFVVSAAVFLPLYYVILSCVVWGVWGPVHFFTNCSIPGSQLHSNAAAVQDRLDRFWLSLSLTAPDPVAAGFRLIAFAVFYAYVLTRALCTACGCVNPKYGPSRAREDASEKAAPPTTCCGRFLAETYNPRVRNSGRTILGPLLRVITVAVAPDSPASATATATTTATTTTTAGSAVPITAAVVPPQPAPSSADVKINV